MPLGLQLRRPTEHGPPSIYEILSPFYKKIGEDLKDAAFHRDESLLTDDQRFAVAYYCGVPVQSSRLEGESLVLTLEPCAIRIVNGQFEVIQK